MKISKLKYVFAFLAVVTLSVVNVATVNATGFKIAEMDINTIIQNQLAAIEDGDDPTAPPTTYANTLAVFNSPYAAGGFNPVHFYAVQNTASGMYTKVYSLNQTQASSNRDGVTYSGNGVGDDYGLALAFGLGSLSSAQAGNQGAMDMNLQARSMATQAYIWALSSGNYNGVRNTLSGSALSYFDSINASIQKAKSNPSYTYASRETSRANAIEMTWNAAAGRYETKVTDANGLDTTELINVIIEAHPNIHYTKNGDEVTFFTSDQIGTAANPVTLAVYKSINNGSYRPGYATTDNQRFIYLSASPVGYEDSATYISFYTNALRVRVAKNAISDPGKTTNKGDVTVRGAVYGVYTDAACRNEVTRLVTGEDGTAITAPLEYKNYYVKELTPAEGCKINTTVLNALIGSERDENGQKVITVTSNENIIYGGMRMIVSVSDLSGNTTKVPSVGSQMKLVLDSDANQAYFATVDARGYAEFTDIPYGHYTCLEMTRPAGYETQDLMDPMQIFIDKEETYIYSKLVNTQTAVRKVNIEIKDNVTRKYITGSNAVFRIFDIQNNKYVEQEITYSEDPSVRTPYTTSEFSTDNRGYVVTAEELPAGRYLLQEVTAPEGYYNYMAATNTTYEFEIVPNTPDDLVHHDKVVTIYNVPQVHEVSVYTGGDVLSGKFTKDEAGKTAENPTYTSRAIPGVRYVITPVNDIVTADGTVRWAAGDPQSYTTDATGLFTVKLFAGTYTLRQDSVPAGYVLESAPKTLEYVYKGQLIETVPEQTITYSLRRQTYDVSLTKAFGDAYFYRQTDNVAPVVDPALFADVTFGIYAKAPIKNILGETIFQKDDLINAIRVDSTGKATVTADLPMGSFYAKELTTNIDYDKFEGEVPFNCVPSNFSDLSFTVDAGRVVNLPKKVTKFTLTKLEEVEFAEVEADEVTPLQVALNAFLAATAGVSSKGETVVVLKLEDATYKVLYKSENVYYPLLEKVNGRLVEVVRTTDENGEFVLEGLPFGDYAVQEIEAPTYYELDSRKYPFSVTPARPTAEGIVEDVRTLVDLDVVIKDEDGNVIPDAKVELVDNDINLVYTVTTDEDGVAAFEQIRAGRYVRKVSKLGEQYVTPEDKEIYAVKDGELVEEVKVRFVVGNIVVYKTDDETGEPVPGCTFQVLDYLTGDVIEEVVTDEDGYARFEGYRYGKYLVQESEAAEDYEKSEEIMEVAIVEDGVDVIVEYTNVYTADIAVALYGVVAMISMVAIVKLSKRLKRD